MKSNPTETGTLLLNEKAVTFSVVRSSKRKRTITLKIHPVTGLMILAPVRTTNKTLQEFMHQHSPWIQKKLADLQRQQTELSTRKFITGENLPYLGHHYKLHIIESNVDQPRCELQDGELKLTMGACDDEDLRIRVVKAKLLHWYRKQAKTLVEIRIKIWSQRLNLYPRQIRLTSPQLRWGSCNAKNNICINWRLIFAPLELLDYVIVHELCHITHKNHSPAFWAAVATALPDYKQRKMALKQQNTHFLEAHH